MKSEFINRIKEGVVAKTGAVFDRVEKTNQKKLTIALLAVFALGVFGLGYLQIRYYLDRPFFSDRMAEDKALIRGPRDVYDYILFQQKNKAEFATLQQRDSDVDGLSDYQEQFVYKTDVYNPDSDGDGVNDGDEVKASSDPNCATGQDCSLQNIFETAGSSQGTTQTYSPVSEQTVSETSPLMTAQTQIFEELKKQLPQDDLVALKSYFQSLSIDELRDQLSLQGLNQEQLDQISDDDLKKMVDSLADTL